MLIFKEGNYYRVKYNEIIYEQAFYKKNGKWFYAYLTKNGAITKDIIGAEFRLLGFLKTIEPFLDIFVRKEKLSKLLGK